MIKRIIALIAAMLILLSLAACGENGTNENTTEAPSTTSYIREIKTNVAAVSDVTGFGITKIKTDRDYAYNVSFCDDVQQVKDLIRNGNADIAAMSLSDALELYNEGAEIKVIAVNNLASTYVLAKGVEIKDISDLKKHTVYTIENDTVTDMFVKKTLEDNGVDFDGLDIKVMADSNEIASAIAGKESYVVMLSGVDAAKLPADEGRKVFLDMTASWIKQKESLPVHTVVVARTDYINSNPDIIAEFRMFNEVAVNFIVGNAETASLHLASEGMFDDAESSYKYLTSFSSLGYAENDKMKTVVSETVEAFAEGELPADDFYYMD